MARSNAPTRTPGSAAASGARNARTDSGPAMAPITRKDLSCHAISSTVSMEGHRNGQQTAPNPIDHRPIDDHSRQTPTQTTTAPLRAVWRNRSSTGAGPYLGRGRRGPGRGGEPAVVVPSRSRCEDPAPTTGRTRPSTRSTRRALPTSARPRTTSRPAVAPPQCGRSASTGAQTPQAWPIPTMHHPAASDGASPQVRRVGGNPRQPIPRRYSIVGTRLRTARSRIFWRAAASRIFRHFAANGRFTRLHKNPGRCGFFARLPRVWIAAFGAGVGWLRCL